MSYEILGACRRLDIDTPLIDWLSESGATFTGPTTLAPIIRNHAEYDFHCR